MQFRPESTARMLGELKVFGGRSHPALVSEICDYLGLSVGQVEAYNFSDGETFCQIRENVRGSDVFVVQSLTDLYGHGGIAHEGTLGAWFDRMPDALILDQRAFWVMCLLILVFNGAGVLSIDRGLFRNAP